MKTLMSHNYLFITGGAVFGKSFFTKSLYQSLTTTFSYRNSSLDKPNILLLALTAVAAVNIDGTTIHSALHTPVGYFGRNLPDLRDKIKSSLTNKYAELKVLVIVEISMVSIDLLFNIHLSLVEIFAFQGNKPFPGLDGKTIEDFFQLQPIRARPVYMNYGHIWKNFEPLWKQLKIVELTEVMRQQGYQLIKMLNNTRLAKLDDDYAVTLKSKFIDPGIANLQSDTLHVFAETAPLDTI